MVNITQGRAALAATAAVDAPALPDDDPTITDVPSWRAIEIAAAARRSLNDPVGFRVSSLT